MIHGNLLNRTRPVKESSEESLWKRVVVGVIFIPLILFLVYLGGAAVFLIAFIVGLVSLREYYEMATAKGFGGNRIAGYVSGAVMIAAYGVDFADGPGQGLMSLVVLIFFVISIVEIFGSNKGKGGHLIDSSVSFTGIIYTCSTVGFFILLRNLPESPGAGVWRGPGYVYLPLAIVWAADTGAYFTGRRFGRTKLAPAISPGKTLEGAAGGIAAGSAAAIIGRHWFAGFLSPVQAIVVGVIVTLAAILGDLFESLLKRDSAFKDSSALIPGHGGMLDRFDSLFFALPVTYFLLKLFL